MSDYTLILNPDYCTMANKIPVFVLTGCNETPFSTSTNIEVTTLCNGEQNMKNKLVCAQVGPFS